MGKGKVKKGVCGKNKAACFLIFLILAVFAFLFKNRFTGEVSLAVELNKGGTNLSQLIMLIGMLFGMLYLVYYFFFIENSDNNIKYSSEFSKGQFSKTSDTINRIVHKAE